MYKHARSSLTQESKGRLRSYGLLFVCLGTAVIEDRCRCKPLVPLQVVKAPGNLVISAYVTCPDITLTVTPDLKLPGSGKLLWVHLGGGKQRLGGSALAHAYSQVRLCTRM